MRIEWESNWGKPTDESEPRKRRNHIFESLRKYAREHYPILKKIREREYEVEKLARDFIAREADVPEDDRWIQPPTLESAHRKICEEQGDQAERAKILRAAMAWSEKCDEIDELKQKAREGLYPLYSKRDPWDYTEEYEARSSLEWTIRDVMVYGDGIGESNTDWNKDYKFREYLENFLDDIASERCHIREDFDNFRLYENLNKYLENPTWHSSIITDFLLVDLIDGNLIDLERDFQFGLFRPRLADQIADIAPEDSFLPSFDLASPTLSPGGKRKRKKWRFKNLVIGSGLIYIWIESLKGEIIVNLLANQNLDLPAWIFTVIGCIGISFLVLPVFSLLLEVINKRRIRYNKLAKAAKKFVVIRFEINSGTYHARTLIERLKKLEEQGIVMHSLTYALLEVREGQ